MIKSIMYYLKKDIETHKIREHLNYVYETDLTTEEVAEAIENILKSKTYQKKFAKRR